MELFYLIEISSIVIAAFLLLTAVIAGNRKSREWNMILRIVLSVLLLSVLTLFYDFYNGNSAELLIRRNLSWLSAFLTAVLNCAKEFFTLLIILFWNMFVDYCTCKSYDHIRKKQKKGLILVGAVSAFFTVAYAYAMVFATDLRVAVVIWNTFFFLNLGIQLLFVVNAIWIVWSGRKRRKPPTFLRLDLFLIPVTAGYILFSIPGVPDIRNLSFAVGAALTVIALMRRGSYVDAETGFYNRTFLRSMNEYMEKHGYPNSIGVYFSAPGSEGKLIPILDSLKPADAEFFSFGKDEYLLLSGPQKESVIRLLIRSVNLKAEQEGCDFTVQTAYAIRGKEETPEAFTKKLSEMTVKCDGAGNNC